MRLPPTLRDLAPPTTRENPHLAKERRQREREERARLRAKRNDPARMRARHMVRAAVQRGELVPQPCEQRLPGGRMCGALPTEAHHEDYDKPLDVVWLCKRCHDRLSVRAWQKARRKRDRRHRS